MEEEGEEVVEGALLVLTASACTALRYPRYSRHFEFVDFPSPYELNQRIHALTTTAQHMAGEASQHHKEHLITAAQQCMGAVSV